MPRFGVVYDFRNPPGSGVDNPTLYAQTLDQVAWLDGLGIDQVWFTEHHFTDDGYLPSWIPVAAAMASRTTRVRFSTDICLLPFQHPLRLAEDLAVLDNISNGRVEVGIGMGYAPKEFAGFGLPVSRRLSLTEEGLEVLTRCFTGEAFSFEGKRYKIDNARITPGYVQEGGPPLWVAATSPASAERAARFNANVLPQGDREQTLGSYYAHAKKLGNDMGGKRVGIIRGVFVTDDLERDMAKVKHSERYRMAFYKVLMQESKQNIWSGEDVIPQAWIVGDVDTCIGELTQFIQNYGVTDIVSWGRPPHFSGEEMAPSLEAYATQVVPGVKARLSATLAQ